MAQIPNVDVVFEGDGANTIFDFDFPYQKQSEIFVSVDGVNTPYTWLAGNTHSVQITPAPIDGSRIRIYRSTLAFVPLHVFAAGVPFLPRYVDENNRQMLYVAQESVNTSTAAMEIANEVRDRIDAAEDIADEALATANNAADVAATATSTANQAATDAADALGVANGIAATANEALETANAADAKADEALEAVSQAGVASFNGRTAIVLPQAGDYNAEQITYGAGNVATGKWDSVAADATADAIPLAALNALTATIRSITMGAGLKATLTGDNVLLENLISATPVGTVLPWGVSRATIPAGWIPRDGQLLNRADWPDLWALVATSAVTDAAWLAAPYTQRGRYSSGNGSSTFRMPDTNGKHADGLTIAAMTLRGDGKNSAGTPGLHQADQLQDFKLTSDNYRVADKSTASRYLQMQPGNVFNVGNVASANSENYIFNSASVLPGYSYLAPSSAKVGTETRGSNETVVWCTVGAGRAVNPGTVDVTALATTVSQQSAVLADVQSKQVLTRVYESAQLAWVANGLLEITHGLGVIPKLVNIEAICLIAKSNTPVGTRWDVVEVGIGSTYFGGQVVSKTATTLQVRFASQITRLYNSTSSDVFAPVDAQVTVRIFA